MDPLLDPTTGDEPGRRLLSAVLGSTPVQEAFAAVGGVDPLSGAWDGVAGMDPSLVAVAAALDRGAALRGEEPGARRALALFDLHQQFEGAPEWEAAQRHDVAVRVLLVGLLAARDGPGDGEVRAAALLDDPFGRALVAWLGAVEVALAFASEMEPPGFAAVTELFEEQASAARAGCADLAPGEWLDAAEE
ncbi:MAG: hypothetical protein D6798_13330, partial [Deltaproteobacteria bacterium]